MYNNTLVKHTIKEVFWQPINLFIVMLELLLVLFFVFGLQLEYDSNYLVSLKVFNFFIDDGSYFIKRILPIYIGFAQSIFLFLVIILVCGYNIIMLKEPILNIIMTKSVTKRTLLTSHFIGIIVLISFETILVITCLSITVLIKGGPFLFGILIQSSILQLVAFYILLSASLFLSLIFEDVSIITVLVLVLYFLSGQLPNWLTSHNYEFIAKILELILPLGKLDYYFFESLQGKSFPISLIVSGIIPICSFLTAALYLFNKKEL